MAAVPRLNALLTPVLENALQGLHGPHAGQPALRLDADWPMPLVPPVRFTRPWEGMLHTGQSVPAFHRALDHAGIHHSRCRSPRLDTFTRRPRMDLGDQPRSFHTTALALCTNGFAAKLLPGLDVNAVPNRVLVLKSDADVLPQGTYHLERGYLYMRTLRPGEILFGGGRHWGHEVMEAGSHRNPRPHGTRSCCRRHADGFLDTSR